MAFAVMSILSLALIVCTNHFAVCGEETRPGLSLIAPFTEETQPGLNPIGLPIDFSMRLNGWPHDTPLLQSHWHRDSPQIASRQTSKTWFGWKNINYMFSLYVGRKKLGFLQ